MSKKTKKDQEQKEKEIKLEKPKKKKKTPYERRKVLMKIVGFIMALIMILGTILSIFGMLLY